MYFKMTRCFQCIGKRKLRDLERAMKVINFSLAIIFCRIYQAVSRKLSMAWSITCICKNIDFVGDTLIYSLVIILEIAVLIRRST